MGQFINQLGEQAATAGTSGIIGGLMGLAFGGINDRRQVKQQRRLNELSKEMTEYNYGKQMQMWRDTGYGATKEQMKEAGLNPALLYGMGSPGGQSTSVATAGAANAPSGGGELTGMTGMGIQSAMQMAQIRNMEADTKKKEAEAAATAGVQTDVGKQNIEESKTRQAALMQGIDNAQAQKKILEVEEGLKKMDMFEKNASQGNRMDMIAWQAGKAMKDLEIAANEAYISSETKQQKVEIIKQAAVEAVLRNAVLRASEAKGWKDVALTEEQIKATAAAITQKWSGLELEKGKLQLDKELKELKMARPELSEMIGEFLNDGLRGLERVMDMSKPRYK